MRTLSSVCCMAVQNCMKKTFWIINHRSFIKQRLVVGAHKIHQSSFFFRQLFSTSTLGNMAGTSAPTTSSAWIAAVQMTAGNDKVKNMQLCNSLIERAVLQHKAKMVFLPEGFDFISSGREESLSLAEKIDGPVITNFRNIAKKFAVWLSLGGFHKKLDDTIDGVEKVSNVHLVLDGEGNIVSAYEKVHLFDVCLPEQNILLRESQTVKAGEELLKPIETPIGNVGLAICYDVRFPEFSERLRREGAHVLTYPSAFTVHTGKAHWEILLRARAIENQCYVIAAAQVGTHNAKRSSYGHSMIVDPWGTILAEACENDELIFAEVDLEKLHSVRQKMPVSNHKRYDILEKMSNSHKCSIPRFASDDVFDFGNVKVKTKFSFLESEYSRAFVNAKPIRPGHVLVISKRVVKRVHELTQEELTDLYSLVQKVGIIMESIQKTTAANVATQDGPDAGQSIQHVHVHVLPRRAGDFERNDDVYHELENYGKENTKTEDGRKWRTDEEMQAEAESIRGVIRDKFSAYLK